MQDKLSLTCQYKKGENNSINKTDEKAEDENNLINEKGEINDPLLINFQNTKRKFSQAFPNDKLQDDKKFKVEESHTEEKEINTEKEAEVLPDKEINLLKSGDSIIFYDTLINLNQLLSSLCKCSKCMNLYKTKNIEFLLSEHVTKDWEDRELIEDLLNKQADEYTEDDHNIISEYENSNLFSAKPIEKVIRF